MRIWAFILLITAFVGFISCAKIEVTRELPVHQGNYEFQQYLGKGAGNSFHVKLVKDQSLSLTSKNTSMYNASIDPMAESIGWATFNTNMTEGVDENALESWAENYVSTKQSELKLNLSDLTKAPRFNLMPKEGMRIFTWYRTFEAKPVIKGYIQLIFAKGKDNKYHLREMINKALGTIVLSPESIGDSPEPSSVADATGIEDLALTESIEAVIIPVVSDNSYNFYEGSRYKFSKSDTTEVWTVTVFNHNAKVYEASSNRSYADRTIKVSVWDRSYIFDKKIDIPLAFAAIADQITDAKGIVDIAEDTVEIILASPQSATGIFLNGVNTVYSIQAQLEPDGTTTITPEGDDMVAINTFTGVQNISDYIAKFLPENFQIPLITNGIRTNINLPDVCNAFYDGNSINFFVSGAAQGGVTCANTGLIDDVIYHEWGHALDANLGTQPGIPDGAFSEGIGDIVAGFYGSGNVMAPGFFEGSTNGIRNLENNATAPPANDEEAQVHIQGQIVGGAFWDMRKGFIRKYGKQNGSDLATELFVLHLITTDFYVDSYKSVLRLADEDGNPATPETDYCLINKAFGKHNITDGEAVEGDDCIDPDQGLKLRVDIDHGDGELTMIASAFGADHIVICDGQQKECLSDDKGYYRFANITPETEGKAKRLYEAKGKINISTRDNISLISKDDAGETIGYRWISFSERDRSNDISQK